VKIDEFKVLSAEEFNRLPQAAKMEYLRRAVAACNEKADMVRGPSVNVSAPALESAKH